MSVQFITRPYSKKLGKGEGGYRGRIVGRTSRSFKEIAETLGIPLGTALTWMHAATLRLKKELGKWK